MNKRIIPVILIYQNKVVKTVNFKNVNYIGDPLNTVCIFNELLADEIIILDISPSKLDSKINYKLLEKISSNIQCPAAYGGGVKSIQEARKIFQIGYEKVILNSALINNFNLISQISQEFGSQSTLISLDFKKNNQGQEIVFLESGKYNTNSSPLDFAKKCIKFGCGEILLNDIDREGTWKGLNIYLAKEITKALDIPIIIHGGACNNADIINMTKYSDASAIGLGNMVVYQKKDKGVLINYPKFI